MELNDSELKWNQVQPWSRSYGHRFKVIDRKNTHTNFFFFLTSSTLLLLVTWCHIFSASFTFPVTVFVLISQSNSMGVDKSEFMRPHDYVSISYVQCDISPGVYVYDLFDLCHP